MSASIPKTAASFETTLDAQAIAGSTSLTLTSVVDADGNNLAAGLYGFTLDGDTDYKEFVIGVLSGSTVSSVFSVSVQNVATSGTTQYHRRGAQVAITDWIAIGRLTAAARGDASYDGSAPLYYDAHPTFASDTQIVDKKYVDDLVNGGTVSYNQVVLTSQTAGENLTIRDHVYFKESDQRWYKVDSDDSATYLQVKRGFVLATQTTGGTIQVAVAGLVTGFTGLTAGAKYYASSTGGAITTGQTNAFIGIAQSTTVLIVDPYVRDIPTGQQKDALAGSLGTPSSTNLYLTQLNETTGGTDQSQTTQNATQGVGLANTTGLNNKLAQSFIPTKTKIRGVALYKSADTGTFTGTVTIALQANSGSAPSGSDLASVTLTNAQWATIPTGEFYALFSSEYASLTLASTYWIVISTSTSDTSNHPNVGTNSAGGYANGSVKYNNSTDGWVAIATIDLYFKTLEGNASQVVYTGTDGYINPSLVPQIVAKRISQVSFNATASETAIFSRLVEGGLLGSNNMFRGRIYVSTFSQNAASDSFVLRVKYGGTTVVTATVASDGASAVVANLEGFIDFEILANGSTTSQVGTARIFVADGGTEADNDAAVQISKAYAANNGTASEDSSTDLLITVTGQYASSNANNVFESQYGYVELVRQP